MDPDSQPCGGEESKTHGAGASLKCTKVSSQERLVPRKPNSSTGPALGPRPPRDPGLCEESRPVESPTGSGLAFSENSTTGQARPSQKEFPSRQVGAGRGRVSFHAARRAAGGGHLGGPSPPGSRLHQAQQVLGRGHTWAILTAAFTGR